MGSGIRMFNNLVKAVVGVVTLPVDLTADFITLGGALTDKPRPYTATKAMHIMANLNKATKP